MARAYYSTVLEHSAEAVWSRIRCFGDYAWSGVDAAVTIEQGKSGDQVGAVRRIEGGGRTMRQVLLGDSDLARSYSYAFLDTPPFPVRNYQGAIRVLPVVDGGRAVIEWFARFDCDMAEQDRWVDHFSHRGFAVWLAALRTAMA